MTEPGVAGANPHRLPQDGVQVATDLHTLLNAPASRGRMCSPGIPPAASTFSTSPTCTRSRSPAWFCWTRCTPSSTPRSTGGPRSTRSFGGPPQCSRRCLASALATSSTDSAYGDLPPLARDEQRAFWSTPRHSRSVRDEFSEAAHRHGPGTVTDHARRPTTRRPHRRERSPRRMDGSTGRTRRTLDERRPPHLPKPRTPVSSRTRQSPRSPADAIRDVVNAVRSGAPVMTQMTPAYVSRRPVTCTATDSTYREDTT